MKAKMFGLFGIGLLAATFMAHAAVITSVNRATFQAAVAGGAINQQTFDSLANGTLLTTLAGVTYSASVGSPIVTNQFLTTTIPNGLGRTGASGPLNFFLATDVAGFSFGTPITAFAIDVNTFATTNGAYQAVLSTGDIVASIFEVFPGATTGQFIGFVSNTPFTSVSISALTGFSYTLDTMVYGDAAALVVPEPATLALLSLGLAGLGFSRRKQ